MAKKGQDIQDRTFRFACRVVKLDGHLCSAKPAYRSLSHQLLRSATSVGANLEEADAGQSRADFLSKIRIALKEAREAYYWLRLLVACDLVSPDRITDLTHEANQIVAILTTIAKKTQQKRTDEVINAAP
jgi:four helix bundle protein